MNVDFDKLDYVGDGGEDEPAADDLLAALAGYAKPCPECATAGCEGCGDTGWLEAADLVVHAGYIDGGSYPTRWGGTLMPNRIHLSMQALYALRPPIPVSQEGADSDA